MIGKKREEYRGRGGLITRPLASKKMRGQGTYCQELLVDTESTSAAKILHLSTHKT